ncbi:MAG: Na+/H+ antiporter subunit C [Cucumibacter sp.]
MVETFPVSMPESIFAGLVGVFFMVAIYLLLSRSLIRMLLGVVLLGNAANLLIFVVGRLTRDVPPIVPGELSVPAEATANPLPQALILTAIVIGFSLFAFLLVLAYRAYQELDADNTDTMRLAEPENPPRPPESY